MPSLGWQELLLIVLIVAMIFGTSKLSGIGGDLGRGIREFKRESTADEDPDQLPATTESSSTSTTGEKEKVPMRAEVRADEI